MIIVKIEENRKQFLNEKEIHTGRNLREKMWFLGGKILEKKM